MKDYDNVPSLYDNTSHLSDKMSHLVDTAEKYDKLLDRMLIIQERQLRGRYQQQADEPANIFDIIIGGGFFVWLLVWLPLSSLFGG